MIFFAYILPVDESSYKIGISRIARAVFAVTYARAVKTRQGRFGGFYEESGWKNSG